jgi:geranylgeranyl pyrophosphate synthase
MQTQDPIHNQRVLEMERNKVALSREKDALKDFFQERYNLLEDDISFKYCFFLLDRRFDVIGVRSYFTQKIGEYLLHEQQKAIADYADLLRQIGFIAELIIVIQYLHNQILDQKFEVKTNELINRNLLASNILRELLFDYIDEKIAPEHRTNVANTVAKILMYVDIGQMMELNYGHYDSFQAEQSSKVAANSEINQFIDTHLAPIFPIINQQLHNKWGDKKDFAEHYFRRIFLTNTSLFVHITELLCKVLKINNVQSKEEVRRFSAGYGMIVQVVNDITDMVYIESDAVGKTKDDVFSDLRNCNITLPLLLHLQHQPKRWIWRYLNNPQKYAYIIEDFKTELMQELREGLAVETTIELARQLLVYARQLLQTNNSASPLLNDMLKIGEWNKYYREWYKNKKQPPKSQI